LCPPLFLCDTAQKARQPDGRPDLKPAINLNGTSKLHRDVNPPGRIRPTGANVKLGFSHILYLKTGQSRIRKGWSFIVAGINAVKTTVDLLNACATDKRERAAIRHCERP